MNSMLGFTLVAWIDNLHHSQNDNPREVESLFLTNKIYANCNRISYTDSMLQSMAFTCVHMTLYRLMGADGVGRPALNHS